MHLTAESTKALLRKQHVPFSRRQPVPNLPRSVRIISIIPATVAVVLWQQIPEELRQRFFAQFRCALGYTTLQTIVLSGTRLRWYSSTFAAWLRDYLCQRTKIGGSDRRWINLFSGRRLSDSPAAPDQNQTMNSQVSRRRRQIQERWILERSSTQIRARQSGSSSGP